MSPAGVVKEMNISIPEEGQIVTVRQRRFVVADIEKSSLPTRSKNSFLPQSQHIIQLNSIEEVLAGLHGDKAKKKWIKEHGKPNSVSKQGDQLSLIDAKPKQVSLLEENKGKTENIKKKPTYFHCCGCGKLLPAEDRDEHTRDMHNGDDPGYSQVRF